ncbi:Peroxiredoxin [Georgfuchsia toluolica]|uniref:Peroxiredoxin n=1 Tax=Georgfuchsia toluolica TaxID=424218 RepID=A0A916N169_9PROT|nr:peroxiredoxin [Georgfuchsia toluolica]CAG4884603.1 Peroxiredoxin [Georgfuchsia toluolica]
MENVWKNSLPRLNEQAPDFSVKTTQGPRKLEDYRGKWLILFSHPADFTPVCTSEIVAFSRAHARFKALGCELLGLSIDSNFAHLAWIRNIRDNFDVDVPFPIIEDLSMRVAQDYGMIQSGASDTSTVRAAFFIDPESKVQAMVYYPMSNGRSVDEFLRMLAAMQTADRYCVATPEGWQPGEKVVVPPPTTIADADARAKAGYEYVDWYFSKTELPKARPKPTRAKKR